MPNSKLPERPSLEYLRKLAKVRLQELRRSNPDAKLASALLHLAHEYGFTSWRALKAQIEGHRAKKIVSPAMRFLVVADVDRSIAFYRDVLGFEVREQEGASEAVLGPVRIRFGKEGYSAAARAFEIPRPPGSAILFLQSADIVATHAALRARGGSPSEIENVNWIKMRMFEIRDRIVTYSGLDKATIRGRTPQAVGDRNLRACGRHCRNCPSITYRPPLLTIVTCSVFGSIISRTTLA